VQKKISSAVVYSVTITILPLAVHFDVLYDSYNSIEDRKWGWFSPRPVRIRDENGAAGVCQCLCEMRFKPGAGAALHWASLDWSADSYRKQEADALPLSHTYA